MPARVRREDTRAPSRTSRALLERAAAAHAEPGEQPGRRAEAGEAGLQQVQADECGQQVPRGRDEMAQREAGQDHGAGEGEDCAVEVHVDSPLERGRAQRVRMMPSSLSTYFSYTGSVLPDFIFIRKYFSKATLATCTQRPTLAQVTLRGGICGSATKATPVSPMSARQIAFQLASTVPGLPAMSAWMLRATVVTMDSIMKPVFGAPVGTGVASTGGMATHTPSA